LSRGGEHRRSRGLLTGLSPPPPAGTEILSRALPSLAILRAVVEAIFESGFMTDSDEQQLRPPQRREFWPPEAAVLRPPPPDISKKHNDLEAIKKAVDDAAAVGGPLWLSYLFTLFYIALATAGVTHVDLLLENPVELPFLNIKLPLIAFFILAPILFVIVHAYTMAHFVLLADKAARFHRQLHAQIGPHVENADDIRNGLRRQLPSNIFVQFLAGPKELREGKFGWLLLTIAWVSLVGGPVALLLLIQLQFLPYHSSAITWTARLALFVDLALIWWLLGLILAGRDDLKRWYGLQHGASKALGAVASLAAIVFSWLVATFPGEWEEAPYNLPPFTLVGAPAKLMSNIVFEQYNIVKLSDMTIVINNTHWPANILQLRELNIYEALKLEPEKMKWKEYILNLRERRLEFADFDGAKLDNIDFQKASLRGASFNEAHLQGARFDLGDLTGASFTLARLAGASLENANLTGASLFHAHLEGASLAVASLSGASLDRAQLQGASLFGAKLIAASLESAQLQAALLDSASLNAALLENARLDGASLVETRLEGALLQNASLQAAFLSDVRAWRANWGRLTKERVKSVKLGRIEWSLEQDHKDYDSLRNLLERIPDAHRRDAALERLQRLNCNKDKKDMQSCDPKGEYEPPVVDQWRNTFEQARVSDDSHQHAFVEVLRGLVCDYNENAILVLRRIADDGVLGLSFTKAPALIDEIMSDNGRCPASNLLESKDKNLLLKVKAANEKPSDGVYTAPASRNRKQ
jgi:uncharacterized protein YjbI with pentapeptide repeats